ncbi:MAG TPA: tyrosine-protein phosphatase [Pseudonocardia sp.]|nr:tyrosine-protein phosphatase [Pseudonocardia sp.]
MISQDGSARWVRLDGVENVRDLGGVPLSDGGATAFGQLLRCARLAEATESDVEFLTEKYGVRTVIDLRTPREVEKDGPTPLELAGVRTEHLSVLPEGQRPLPRDGEDPKVFNYRGYLRFRPENMVAAVRLLTEPDAGPALVHCAAGKDRTGVFSALVLDAVGAAREAVVADYALSNLELEAVLRRGVGGDHDIDLSEIDKHRCPPEVMSAVLAGLDAEGAAVGWLRAQGMPDEELTRLRTRFAGSNDR